MQKYIAQRILLMFPTLIGLTLLIFVGLRAVLPADVVDIMVGEYGRNDPALRERLEKQLGLDANIASQYLDWTGVSWFIGGPTGILQGDLGESFHSGRPVVDELRHRLPVTIELGLWAQFTSLLVAVPLGVYAAVRQDKLPDYGLRGVAILFSAVPSFWIAVLAITLLSIWFEWAPPLRYKDFWEDPAAHLGILLMPALIIGLTPGAGLLRLVRTQMLEVMRQDYVRTARAKGLSTRSVLYSHALRNALIPIVTVVGISLPNIIAGTVIFEQIFLLPGIGRYLIESINTLDYPVVQSINLLLALMLVFAVLLIDISYAFLDPRIKLS